MSSTVADKLLGRGKDIAASQTLVTLPRWRLSWLGLDLLLGVEVVRGGEVGLQVSLHCWQVGELLSTVTTFPSGEVELEE